jgi:ketopantoate reductase
MRAKVLMSILVVGAGATGGYFGDLVAEGGKAGVRTPLLEAATVALRVHNAAVSGR